MKCPKCGVELLASHREGIQIDCCPKCGGIWLDHGELMEMIFAYVYQLTSDVGANKSVLSRTNKESGQGRG